MNPQSTELATQHEVDGVALFVEAATQLSNSKFFIEEHINLGLSGIMKDGEFVIQEARFPAPEVRDSMLLPFRRIWMDREPSNFFRILKTLKRYVPHWRNLLEDFHDGYGQRRKHFLCPLAGKSPTLPPQEVIDLWLNQRFAHVSCGTVPNCQSVHDFVAREKEFGAIRFEFLFYQALFEIGLEYINLRYYADDLIRNKWQREGLKPSFNIVSRPTDVLSTYRDGVVIRSTPGVNTSAITPLERLQLLLRRRAFSALNDFVRLLSRHNASASHLFVRAESLHDWLHSLGVEAVLRNEEIQQLPPDSIGFTSLLETSTGRRGFAIEHSNNRISLFEDAEHILRDQFQYMKNQVEVYEAA